MSLCNWEMRVLGDKDKLLDFYSRLVKPPTTNYFFGIVSAKLLDIKKINDTYIASIIGECMMSVQDCFIYKNKAYKSVSTIKREIEENDLVFEIHGINEDFKIFEYYFCDKEDFWVRDGLMKKETKLADIKRFPFVLEDNQADVDSFIDTTYIGV